MNLIGVGSTILGALLMLNVIPLATLQVDTAPPTIYSVYPSDGATYSRLDTMEAITLDENGIQSVSAATSWAGTISLQPRNLGTGEWVVSLSSAQALTNTGSYTVSFTSTDTSGSTKILSTSFKIAALTLQGRWMMNDVVVTASNQKVTSRTPQITFTFVKDTTATSVADNAITVTVSCISSATVSCNKLSSTTIPMVLNSATHTWTGSASFPDGIYSLLLKADAGSAGVIALNVTGSLGDSPLSNLSMNTVLGAALMIFGVVLIVKRKETI